MVKPIFTAALSSGPGAVQTVLWCPLALVDAGIGVKDICPSCLDCPLWSVAFCFPSTTSSHPLHRGCKKESFATRSRHKVSDGPRHKVSEAVRHKVATRFFSRANRRKRVSANSHVWARFQVLRSPPPPQGGWGVPPPSP